MPKLVCLFMQGGQQTGIPVPERIYRDTGRTIQIGCIILCIEPATLTAHKGDIRPSIGRHHCGLSDIHFLCHFPALSAKDKGALYRAKPLAMSSKTA
jgi:hypothetical protein